MPDNVEIKSLSGYDSSREELNENNTLIGKSPVVIKISSKKCVLV